MSPRRVLAVVPDLFFATRISATAEGVGVELAEATLAGARTSALDRAPDLVILDLHSPGDPLALVRALKSDPRTAGIPIVGFYSHVERELREAALRAGVDHVLPRSAFTARLARLLWAGLSGGGPGLLDSAPSDAPEDREDPMTHETDSAATRPAPRVRVSCPGCGRNDYVAWPENEAVYHWKCFNCGKEFDLTRDGGH